MLQEAVKGLIVVTMKSYTIIADEPFSVRCVRPNGETANIINAEMTNASGMYMMKFEVVPDARLFVNEEEIIP